jgi:16S rRNA (adenine1518-N6/adenine1519-N6)-dimethyltransferase
MGNQIQALNPAELLRQHGLRPDKRLGQNFLVDEIHLTRIVQAAEVESTDEVLEVGPGLGALTRHLAAAAQRVVAVELDGDLLPPLRQVLEGCENVEIVHGDILEFDPAVHFRQPGYLVVANIPYYLTSNLIRHLLESDPKPGRIALTVQREVARRATAAPGNLSLLALSIQLYGQPRIVHHIPAGAFYPVPKVDSSLLLIDLYDAPELAAEHIDSFFELAKAAFNQKRKTLANSLAAQPGWDKELASQRLLAAGIEPRRRPQTLSLQEWGRLVALSR